MTLVVGLTGGIGCGKSTVANLFAQQGAAIIDTDEIAHRLTQSGGEAITAIRSTFGDACLSADGAMDRSRMRQLIFSDASAKQRLESILHPLILAQAKVQLRQLHHPPYVILVVPLLPESPAFQQLVQRILVVDCDINIQVARIIQRSQLSEAEVRSIIAQQTSRTDRLKLANDIIHNDAGLDSLAEQVSFLHEYYSGMQKSNPEI